MARLIDADKLEFEPDHWGGANGVLCLGKSGGRTMAMILAALKAMVANAPTVDAAPVVHGRWDKCGNCSACGKNFYDGIDADIWSCYEPPFCPNCGAKMNKEN